METKILAKSQFRAVLNRTYKANRIIRVFITAFVTLFMLVSIVGAAPFASVQNTETQITTDGSDQLYPHIYGDRIVWQDQRNGISIYMYDISTSTEKPVSSNSLGYNPNPTIDSNRVVWTSGYVYTYDFSTSKESQLTTDNSAKYNPSIYGNRIVWQDTRNGNFDVYMYDLATSTETQITNNDADQHTPSIFGDRIVWMDQRNGNWDIYMYDLTTSTETQITTNNADQVEPVIYGDKIVWRDYRNGNWDIYVYDLATSTETQITANNTDQEIPSIFGDKIVWQDNRNGNWDIYMYNLSSTKETQITNSSADQINPQIYENKIVWQDNRNGNWDIYTCTLSDSEPISTPTLPVANFTTNVTSGHAPLTVSFTDESTTATYWNWDFGDGTTSDLQNPSHTYSSAGTYTVNLTVTSQGGTSSKTGSINVLEQSTQPETYKFVAKWGSNGNGDGEFNLPFGVAVDSTGNVYVADRDNDRIQKFNSDGTFITKWGSWREGTASSPINIAIDSSDNVYVVEWFMDRVQKFDSNGVFITQWGSYGTGNGQFDRTAGVAVDSSGNVYVADTNNGRIQKFNSNGEYITQWEVYSASTGIAIPYGIDVDSSDNIYVACCNNNRDHIIKFDSDGALLTSWDFYGSGEGIFYYPSSVAVDSSGNVYVADTYNNCVQKFSSSGTFINSLGSKGSEDGQFISPHGVAIDSSGNIYVADTSNNRIQKFSTQTISTPIKPIANFTANVTQGYAPLSVQFYDSSQNSTSWSWDFGDGANSTEQNPVHTFSAKGSYTVDLTVNNENGTDSKAAEITVSEPPLLPKANFTTNVTQGYAPLSVQFYDSSQNSTSLNWDFGDGENTTEQNPVHTYAAAGNYTVNLNAVNGNGTDSRTMELNVIAKPIPVLPTAIIGADNTIGAAPLTVKFNDLSKNETLGRTWDFGDGSNSTDENLTHVYRFAGNYTVKLTANNGNGSSITSLMINVSGLAYTYLYLYAPYTQYNGSSMIYQLYCYNDGTADAQSVILQDQLSDNVTFMSASDGGVYDPATRKVVWNIGTISPGGYSYRTVNVNTQQDLPVGTIIKNDAIIDTSSPEVPYANHEYHAETTIVSRMSYTNIYVSAPSIKDRESSMKYELSCYNFGTADAQSVILQDQLSDNVTFVSASDGGVYDPATGKVVWNIGTISPGGSIYRTVNISIPQDLPVGTVIKNDALISTTSPEVPYANHEYHIQTITGPVAYTNLIFPSVPPAIERGSSMTYTLYCYNYGTADAQSVILQDQLSDNVTFVSASDGGVYDPATGKVVWNIGTISPRGSIYRTVNISIPQDLPVGTVIKNDALISTTSPEVPYANHEYHAVTKVYGPMLPQNVGIEPVLGGTVLYGKLVPNLYWHTPIKFSYYNETATAVDIRIHADGVPDIIGSMTKESTSWTYTVTFNYSRSATVTYTVYGSTQSTVSFNIYIDPAGHIYDADTGERIEGAFVWLQRPDNQGGWENVPTEETIPIAQPDINPLITNADGMYQWDVLAGTYRVHVEALGYEPEDSIVVEVPPPVTDLAIGLHRISASPILPVASFTTNVTSGDLPLTVSFKDQSTDSTSWNWDFGDGNTSTEQSPVHTYSAAGDYIVKLTVSNSNGTDSKTAIISVLVPPPNINSVIVPLDPVPVSASITASASVTYLGSLNALTAEWNWGDGSVSQSQGSSSFATSHVYNSPGIYTVTFTVKDNNEGLETKEAPYYVVVYNPKGGFVTGGGWINSPAGAYVPDKTLVGKATFGFVSKYEKGATVPTGNTEFQFKVASLNFHSENYDWLVVTGSQAKYKGTGTINGKGNYGFMLSAIDGTIKGDSIDKFRIKIWDKESGNTVYDNEIGTGEDAEPSTAISGGSIVIHKEK